MGGLGEHDDGALGRSGVGLGDASPAFAGPLVGEALILATECLADGAFEEVHLVQPATPVCRFEGLGRFGIPLVLGFGPGLRYVTVVEEMLVPPVHWRVGVWDSV